MSSFNGIVQGWLDLAKAGAEATLKGDPDKGAGYIALARDICIAADKDFPGWIFDKKRLKIKGGIKPKLGLYKYFLDGEEKTLPEIEAVLTVDPTPYFCRNADTKTGEVTIKGRVVKRICREKEGVC